MGVTICEFSFSTFVIQHGHSSFIKWANIPTTQCQKTFITLTRNPKPQFNPPLIPWQPSIYFPSFWICLFWALHTLCGYLCLLALSTVFFEVHPCCRRYQYFLPFYSWIFHCMKVPHFVVTILASWLIPSFGNFCCKHVCVEFFMDLSFQLIWVNTKVWYHWIIW